MSTTTAKYEINQLGVSTIPIGGWYWSRPDEPISANGPYLFRCLAERAARNATRKDT